MLASRELLLTVRPHVPRQGAPTDSEMKQIEDPSLQQRVSRARDRFKKGRAEDGDWIWAGFEGFTELGKEFCLLWGVGWEVVCR